MPEQDPRRSSATSPLVEAHAFGQSIWLDNISRDLLLSGELRRWVEQEGIRGVTSNPAIFEKAIAKTQDYDPAARALIGQGAGDAQQVFERLAIQDIQLGCDVLRPVWEESGGRDGFVSLEVSPHLASDTEGTIAEARRLAADVARENLMIKVPATPAGIPAIQQLIDDGIHVNVTLLFAVEAYEAVHEAYLAGLEARAQRGAPVSGIASVASFFISRIDAAVGQQLTERLASETEEGVRARLEALDAKVAIANAKVAYASFLDTLASPRWARLAEAGAAPQRVLWASTGTKDPALPRTLYVDELIGRHTVNTLPDATLEAFRTEGRVRDALGADPAALRDESLPVLAELEALDISLPQITDELLEKGCTLFSDAFDALLLSVETKRQQVLGDALPRTTYALGSAQDEVDRAAERWETDGGSHALWRREASLFSSGDEARWMGWLDLPEEPPEVTVADTALRAAIRQHPAEHVVVIGMGGSSLWPDVLGRVFAGDDGGGRKPRALHVLDMTVPEAIEARLEGLDLERCLFFVSSKSGSTIEPNALFELVYARLVERVGAERAGRHFVAITDPGSTLAARAESLGFLGTARGRPDVGGRFSALSPFGTLPAEAMGLDPEALGARARIMSAACAPFVTPDRNPGVGLGLTLGTLARSGRDKLTLSLSAAIAPFSDWIEQLVAESTGKGGQGLVPISGEPLGEPDRYANDRIFVDLRVDGDAGADARDARLEALRAAGHPVIRIALADRRDLVQEVFRWEVATAVVGALLGQNPFDQPDVESAKVASRALLADVDDGAPSRIPDVAFVDDGASWFLAPALGPVHEATQAVRALLSGLGPNDVFALNVFLPDSEKIRGPLESLRERVGSSRRVATSLDFGPRYLHSTGQLQKGGPDRLAGLQLWQSASGRIGPALTIPEMGNDFDRLAEAQAVGDFSVLADRGRRMIGIDVGGDPVAAIERLNQIVDEALASCDTETSA